MRSTTQIMVKHPLTGKTITLDVAPDDTMSTVAAAFLKKSPMGTLASDGILFGHGNKEFDPGMKLEACNVWPPSAFQVRPRPKDDTGEDTEVIEQLKLFLTATVSELSSHEFIFVGIGSFDSGGHDADSVNRQQCPSQMLDFCLRSRSDLNIILIDPTFAVPDQQAKQIYDGNDWVLLNSEFGGKIRRYKNTYATRRAACDVWLTVFGTAIREYKSKLTGQGKVIAGYQFYELLKQKITLQRLQATVVCGNFYGLPTNEDQYFTLGKPDTIARAGFKYNP